MEHLTAAVYENKRKSSLFWHFFAREKWAIFVICFVVTIELLINSTLRASFPILASVEIIETLRYFVLALAIITLMTQAGSDSKQTGIFLAVCVAVAIASQILSGRNHMLYNILLILICRQVESKKLMRAVGGCGLIVVCCLMLLCAAGLVYNRDSIPNGSLVFSFGFGHPNTTGAYLFGSLAALAYGYWDNRWQVILIATIFFGVFAKVFFSSNTTFILCVWLSLAISFGHCRIVQRWVSSHKKPLAVFVITIPIVLCALVITMSIFYDSSNDVMLWLDHIAHGRFRFAHDYFVDNGGFTIFGRLYTALDTFHNGRSFEALDSGYANMLMIYGVASLIVGFILFIRSVAFLSESDSYFPAFALYICGALQLLLESYALFIPTFIPLALFSFGFRGPHCLSSTGENVTYGTKLGQPQSN